MSKSDGNAATATTTTAAERPGRPRPDLKPQKKSDRLKARAEVYGLLSDGSRLAVLEYLLDAEPTPVNVLATIVGCSLPTINHQVAILRYSNAVEYERIGKQRFYRLNPDHPVAAILGACAAIDA